MENIEDILDKYPRKLEKVCSNFDHVINQDVVEELKRGDCHAFYPGWNFHGTVWFDKEKSKYRCAVMQYGILSEILEGETFEELKQSVCEKYGSE